MRQERHERKRSASYASAVARAAAGALLSLLVAFPAIAEETPVGSEQDVRLKFVDYDESNVVRLVGHFGYAIHITFAPGELVTSAVLGDTLAWEVAPAGNHLFVKPREDNARTNMTVLTNKDRAYTFYLETSPRRPGPKTVGTDLFLRVTFRYPMDERAKAAKLDVEEIARKRLADAKRDIRNINYFACGADEVNPDQAFDDGRFTFLRYAGSREIPAVFVVNADGSEALVDSHIEVDTIVVHRLAERFVFRHGGSVGCIVNKSFDPRGVETLSGTVDEGVVRVMKGTSL